MKKHRHLFDICIHRSAKLIMSRSSETYGMQTSTGPPENTNEEDQDDQVWEDVKAETGFSSYKEYVKTLWNSKRRFGRLLQYMNNPNWWNRGGEIFLLDIQKDGSTVTSFNAAYPDEAPQPSYGFRSETDRKISTRLLQNLRSPPEDIPARIVLYSIPRQSQIHAGIFDALGLGLDIDPSFFDILHQMTLWGTLLCTRPHQMIIGGSVATVARDYRRQQHAPAVLVIAGCFDLHFGFSRSNEKLNKPYYRILEEVVKQEMSVDTSLFRSTVDRVLPNNLASVPSNYYLKLLSKNVYKDCYIDSEVDAILLIAVLPLLRLEILRLRGQCSMISSVLIQVQDDTEHPRWATQKRKEWTYTILDKHRFWLRRRLEGLQESRDTLLRFARSQNVENWLETRPWLSQDADIKEALAMARTKELEVRDFMQLQIGNLSILESRKSIQLSNQQMNEAKRGKKSIKPSFVIFANRAKVKVRTKPIHLVSALTLMSVSHYLGFCLRTY